MAKESGRLYPHATVYLRSGEHFEVEYDAANGGIFEITREGGSVVAWKVKQLIKPAGGLFIDPSEIVAVTWY